MEVGGKPGRVTIAAAIALMCLIWGSTWLVIKEGLHDLPTFSSAAYRFTIAAAIFVVIAPWLHRRERGERPPLRLALTTGICNFAVSYGIVYWAETVIPSGLASVLWGVFPMMMALAGHVVLPGERVDPRSFVGFAVGLVGVVVLFATDLRAIGPDAIGKGAVLLLSPLIATIGQVITKRDGARVSASLLNRDAMIIGAALLWIFAAIVESPLEVVWTRRALLSVGYLATMGTVVGFGLYYWILRWIPSNRLSLIAYVTPALALWLGWVVEDEALKASTIGGTLLVLGGIALVVRARRS
ncbi:MAG TPA: DMT family transporter [Nannocystaceae bacterium]|nr:DMT family transporter [Nannocystaceae bacterium]